MIRTISWPDKSLAAEVCCAAGVLQDLEIAAVDGLLAMPRIGLGIGGLLLGRRWNRRIEVLRVLSIPCSHALGPAFVLTAEEMPAVGWQGGKDGPAPGYELVGCYWSKPNGNFAPTDYDHVLFKALCPEPWQVALVIRPSLSAVTTAALGLRGDDNKLILGVPCDLIRKEEEETETEAIFPSDVPPGAEPEQSDLMRSVEAFAARVEATPEVVAHEERAKQPVADLFVPVPMPESGILFGAPQPKHNLPPPGKTRWPSVLLAFVILLVILATSAFFTRNSWMPRWRSAVRTYLPDSGISK